MFHNNNNFNCLKNINQTGGNKAAIIIIVVILILLGVGGYFLYKKKKDDAATAAAADNNDNDDDDNDNDNDDVNTSYKKGYYLSKKCPDDFKGTKIGLIVPKSQSDNYDFEKGGSYNDDWRWIHPNLCKGTPNEQTIKNLYGFTKKENDQKCGIIVDGTVSDKDLPFTRGGTYNSSWNWMHPYLTNNYDDMQLFSTEREGARSGIIVDSNVADKDLPFTRGGNVYSGWDWMHPYIKKE